MDEYIFNPNELLVSSLGLTDYETSWAIQQSLCDSRQTDIRLPNTKPTSTHIYYRKTRFYK